MTFKECPGRPCIFIGSQCYYVSNQQGSSAEKRFKYGCTKTFLTKLIWVVILYNAAMVTCAMTICYEDISFKTIDFCFQITL